MSKFNKAVTPQQPDTENRAGGQAYTERPEIALVNLLLTSFMKDKYYEIASDETKRLDGLLAAVDPEFAAKAAVYARTKYGMRSITHYTAAWVAKHVKGAKWTKRFFKRIIHRPDDITEILSCYQTLNGSIHPIPAALKRGLAEALAGFKPYALAKYKMDGKHISMVDAINLVHPRHTEGIAKLVKGTLETADTWETAISAAGKTEGGEEAVEAKKKEEWSRLIKDHRLGYFALIRNIRNIIEAGLDDEAFKEFLTQLTEREAIKKSLVFPFRILVAYLVAKGFGHSYRQRGDSKVFVSEVALVQEALSQAMDLSLDNVPELPGRTLVALDRSGSMTTAINSRSFGETPVPVSARDIGAIFAAALVKKGADLMLFHDRAWYHRPNTLEPVVSIAEHMPEQSGGTNFHSIFQTAQFAYTRIIILSDMQAWVGYNTPSRAFKDYCQRYHCRDRAGGDLLMYSRVPHIYCIDLTAYGDTQFPEKKVYQLAGFSDKIFDTMRLLETDREALLHEIEAIEL